MRASGVRQAPWSPGSAAPDLRSGPTLTFKRAKPTHCTNNPMLAGPCTPELELPSTHSDAMGLSPALRPAAPVLGNCSRHGSTSCIHAVVRHHSVYRHNGWVTGAGLAGHPCPGDLKWASRPFDPYPACLFGASMGTSRPPAHRLPSRFEQNRAKKSENLKGMQWTG
jgi:hypothetical protein